MLEAQRCVIVAMTVSNVCLQAAADEHGAAEMLAAAVAAAPVRRLPHQLQRIGPSAGRRLPAIISSARRALDRLRQETTA